MTAELVAAAAVELLAENLSDSIVAPLFYYAWFGLPGAAAYRLFNTFDSMIGYRGEYEYLGKAAARLDDLLNLLPSRLSALLIIGLAPLYGGDIWQPGEPGATMPEKQPAQMRASRWPRPQELCSSTGKTGHYKLGQPVEPLTPETIKKAERMVWMAGMVRRFCWVLPQRLKQGRRKLINKAVVHGALDFAELENLDLDPADILDFSVNSNPYGPSPLAKAALAKVKIERYPDRECLGFAGPSSSMIYRTPD